MQSLIASICASINAEYLHHERVHGGDINEAYIIKTSQGKMFVKINDASAFPQMFLKEADGLNALRKASSIKVPDVIKAGELKGQQFLVMECIETGKAGKNFFHQFGRQVAALHQNTNPVFGWHTDNYMGSLAQKNLFTDSWASFYTNCRLLPLTKILNDRGSFSLAEVKHTEILCGKLHQFFPPEKPALLHGDLWSGNFMVGADDKAAVYDPAVYYGHREMDIAMTRLFGGFSTAFYEAYNEVFPLENGWQQRMPLAQLYPLLVHAVLFGGGYVSNCRSVIMQWS
jgi:fructosamine-3-kinase